VYKYEIERLAADCARDELAKLRQAERDAAQHCGMAFDGDNAEEVYQAALEHSGIPRSETDGLSASTLRILLRRRPAPGSQAWRDSPAMAFDSTSSEKSVLDDILAGA
jgi:hypothetical protein